MILRTPRLIIFLLVAATLVSGCKVYKQDILFNLDENFTEEDLSEPVQQAMENHILVVNDWVEVNVFANDGERLVDPEQMGQQGRQNQFLNFQYLVQSNGVIKLPMVGLVKVSGLTIQEAESVIEQAYDEFFKDSFVKMTLANRRVVVLGVNGGQVLPLTNEHTSLAEVLALSGGLNLGAKAGNIRLIRGDLSDPEVFLIDMTTISGMRESVVDVLPGDIIYIEPWRRPWQQALRDISPILSITSSVIAFVLVIQNLTN
ncbi:MAG: polysaccharide biosynthesis/export family protein [Cyclobacteriaceae bacterium]